MKGGENMKEKKGIKTGKLELIPITRNISFNDVEKRVPNECFSLEQREWCKTSLEEYEVLFVVYDLINHTVVANVLCKNDIKEESTVELLFRNIENLNKKDFCSIVYYSSEWLFKYVNKNKVFLLNNYDKETVNRLKLLEFKKSKKDGYLERNIPDNDPTTAILSVLSGL